MFSGVDRRYRHHTALLAGGGGCGFTPTDFQKRYGLTPYLRKGANAIVAVIEEGDSPRAASDLTTYRNTFHLGKATFAKYNQKGQKSSYPSNCQKFSWCIETETQIRDGLRVSCPKCTIYLMGSDAPSPDSRRPKRKSWSFSAKYQQ